jgi:hypothetical protein
VGWLRQCAGWLTRLHAGEFPSVVNLRPGGDHPERALVVVDLPRVAAILDRIAADIDELARARRVGDLAAAAVLPGRRAERRRRVAEPDLDFREFCRRQKVSASSERSWEPTRPSGTATGNATPVPATPRTRSVPSASRCNA